MTEKMSPEELHKWIVRRVKGVEARYGIPGVQRLMEVAEEMIEKIERERAEPAPGERDTTP